MKSLIKQKKGQILNTTTNVIVGVMILVFVVMAVLFGIATINPATLLGTGTANANLTNGLVANLTSGIGQFGSYIPTAMLVLGAIFVLSFIVLLIAFVYRMKTIGGGSVDLG